VPADDADAYADALARLLGDPDRRERLGRAAQLRALQYTPAAMARRMHALYRQLLPVRADPQQPVAAMSAQ
jgi:glycosyltransferase involved in cell wall biosynthesis